MTPERCTVLADEALSPDELDRGAIEAELQAVEGNLPSLREQVARATGAERDTLLVELRRPRTPAKCPPGRVAGA